jgi:hypothetical protein
MAVEERDAGGALLRIGQKTAENGPPRQREKPGYVVPWPDLP